MDVRDAPEPPRPRAGAWRRLGRALAPRPTRGQLIAGVLCAILGFGLVAQVRETHADDLSSLSQDELVRLLDEVTKRTDSLEQQAVALRSQRADLVTGADSERAALEAAAKRATVQGILAGRLPAQGPGVRLVLTEPGPHLSATLLVDVLEELRNAGAEAIQIDRSRITASSYILDTADGVEIDGVALRAPYVWLVIGDPNTLVPALEMPGGALASVRGDGGGTNLETMKHVVVDAVREPPSDHYATPAPSPPADSSGD
ncbi:DUF881 domain-containing protein [Isoptericola sp. b490]|uniref:DUF881 domain-containing protein n=1 Tax=Actinotalea lenta TaxID=3064654 RepID=UPI002712AA14|nr:DUF881 domain-containing protein [Isoptericola sp. b490]MDO8120595.1 DUF881 domain-containing protein [Isoptericola sp. b490]